MWEDLRISSPDMVSEVGIKIIQIRKQLSFNIPPPLKRDRKILCGAEICVWWGQLDKINMPKVELLYILEFLAHTNWQRKRWVLKPVRRWLSSFIQKSTQQFCLFNTPCAHTQSSSVQNSHFQHWSKDTHICCSCILQLLNVAKCGNSWCAAVSFVKWRIGVQAANSTGVMI